MQRPAPQPAALPVEGLNWAAMGVAGASPPAAGPVPARAPSRLPAVLVTVGRGLIDRPAPSAQPAEAALPAVLAPSLAPVRPSSAWRKPATVAAQPAFVFVDAGAAGAARAAAAAQAARPKVDAPWAPLVKRPPLWTTPLPNQALRAAALPPVRSTVRG